MMSTCPVFIMPDIGESAEGVKDLLARFNLYGKKFAEIAQTDLPILILAGGNFDRNTLIYIQELQFIKVVRVTGPTNNPFYFAFKSANFLKSNYIKSSIYISSNLYVGFVASYLLSILHRNSKRIQVSIHGSLSRSNDSRLAAWLRHRYIWLALTISSSIRVVSSDLLYEVSNSYEISKSKFFISPVPVDIRRLEGLKLDCKVLAFVGRMHPERGLTQWVGIVKALSLVRKDFQILLIGDGPLSNQFETDLRKELPGIQITAKGFLDRSKLASQWKYIKILLSTAESEGYGLALREAVATETFVCAKESNGSNTLASLVPSAVKTFASEDEAVMILNSLLDQRFPPSVTDDFVFSSSLENNKNLNRLVNSWI